MSASETGFQVSRGINNSSDTPINQKNNNNVYILPINAKSWNQTDTYEDVKAGWWKVKSFWLHSHAHLETRLLLEHALKAVHISESRY